ncbi:metallophosphoesterase [Pseudoduganella violacea]|uniref:Calcineurin-like phosphoesterase domain-containing protein n=1 Tax=Pseudoduganella violacea TaxID=1715466 RepID=A0A7W5FUU5_9BURK|nr:metallophosphoesterase [Pseudoduganella violacea]MBB3120290.1 hypothetical protein [Pseudoduganella violacea]
MGKQYRKWWWRSVLGIALLGIGGLVLSLSNARLQLSQEGVHEALYLPLAPGAYAKVHTYAGSGDAPIMPGYLDGPVVRRTAGDHWSASWFCEKRVEHRDGSGQRLDIDCGGQSRRHLLGHMPTPSHNVAAMPEQLVVLSDIEGNLGYLEGALARLQIVDGQGNWAYGQNHLVILGDSVDRGRDVSAVLWRLYGLTQQAHAAGGAVHTLLGNHEQYLLQGRMKSVHPALRYSAQQLGGYRSVFAGDTVLGDWLRKLPVVVQIGPVLFAHGGISASVARQGKSVQELNTIMRAYWRGETAPRDELELVLGRQGLTQYRGYLEALTPDYGQAGEDDVSLVLRTFGARHIVVGHTIVSKVQPLFGGRVYAVDVNSDAASGEVLLFERGVPRTVDIGVARNLPPKRAQARRSRSLFLTRPEDVQAVWQTIASNYELAQLPYPY